MFKYLTTRHPLGSPSILQVTNPVVWPHTCSTTVCASACPVARPHGDCLLGLWSVWVLGSPGLAAAHRTGWWDCIAQWFAEVLSYGPGKSALGARSSP